MTTYNIYIILALIVLTVFEIIMINGYARQKNYAFIIENAIVYVLFLAFLFLQYKLSFFVELSIITFIIIAMLGHLFGGEYLELYLNKKHYDRVLHGFGTFAFTLFAYSIILKTLLPISEPKLYTTLFVAFLGVTLGAIFELLEFTIDLIFKSKSQPGLKDTDVDLVSDLVGAILASLTFAFFI